MNYHKYARDLINYQYLQGETEELDDLIIAA